VSIEYGVLVAYPGTQLGTGYGSPSDDGDDCCDDCDDDDVVGDGDDNYDDGNDDCGVGGGVVVWLSATCIHFHRLSLRKV